MTLSSLVERGVKHLRPVIEARRGRMADDGNDYPDKPVCLVHKVALSSPINFVKRMIYWRE